MNNWGGPRKRSKMIKKIQDKWCRDNGYPVIERKRYPHYGHVRKPWYEKI